MTLGRLTCARHNYIRTKTIVQAHALLVAVQDTIPFARAREEEEVPTSELQKHVAQALTRLAFAAAVTKEGAD